MSSGWNTVETPMCLNGFHSIIRIGSTLSHLHSDAAFSCYLYFHSTWRWLLSYSNILHCLLHSENYWYVHFHSVWWWLLSCRKILHCLLHSDAFYWYVYFHSVWWWLVSYRKIIHHLQGVLECRTLITIRLSGSTNSIQTPSTDMCAFTQSDGDWCLTGRSSTVAYIQTPSTAICTSTQPDGDCYSKFRHLLLLFVLPLSLMVISVQGVWM